MSEMETQAAPSGRGRMMLARRQACAALVGFPVLLAASAASAAVCIDPANITESDRSLREALGFKLHAPDATRQCHTCAFFEAAGEGCGRCQMLSGGPVLPDSVCDSWAKKE